ncbi:hypothetical protein [Roseimaritima ulvae]|uniref:Uncharacterized protein n=1 Tax=Roseimaritima ulvae TaxID=980254 RepID=A0A5B9QNL8_9BACT|nr:hypothetical protein [Roseimaritima ulvae]QEG39250.1 hypothetical protein UC8_12110 [Roseimaritima ulvae]
MHPQSATTRFEAARPGAASRLSRLLANVGNTITKAERLTRETGVTSSLVERSGLVAIDTPESTEPYTSDVDRNKTNMEQNR